MDHIAIAKQHCIDGDLESAIKCFKQAIQADPTSGEAHLELGNCYYDLDRLDDAIDCCNNVIRMIPGCPQAHFNKGLCLLGKERFPEGWLEYEWRNQYYTELLVANSILKPEKKWSGFDDLNGKSILLYAEQGFGDAIHFVRYIRELKKRYDCYVILVCHPSLMPLFKQLKYIDDFYDKELIFKQILPEYDYYLPLMSLHHTMAYYDCEPQPYMKVEQLSLPENKPKIGIAWVGSQCKDFDNRSHSIDHFEFLSHFDLDVYSIIPKKVNKHWVKESNLNDFLDTARLIASMDLIISIDTCVLHLAGALGKKTWAVLAYAPDFRWRPNSSLWYDTVSFYRQPKISDWQSVFGRIESDLDTFLLNN